LRFYENVKKYANDVVPKVYRNDKIKRTLRFVFNKNDNESEPIEHSLTIAQAQTALLTVFHGIDIAEKTEAMAWLYRQYLVANDYLSIAEPNDAMLKTAQEFIEIFEKVFCDFFGLNKESITLEKMIEEVFPYLIDGLSLRSKALFIKENANAAAMQAAGYY
jgi:hypothetical protein